MGRELLLDRRNEKSRTGCAQARPGQRPLRRAGPTTGKFQSMGGLVKDEEAVAQITKI